MINSISNCTIAQQIWKPGNVNTKATTLNCRESINGIYVVQKQDYNSKTDLPFGTSDEKGSASLYINSERIYFKIINEVFTPERLKDIEMVEIRIIIGFTIDENGIPVQITYSIKENSKIKPEEIEIIDKLLKEKIRFKIVRKIPFGEPCVYPFSHILKFEELKNGEFPLLKRNELEGKKYW
ncbi:MAG: hypothetical protein AB7V16_12635 [Vulcanibacillus sp.]